MRFRVELRRTIPMRAAHYDQIYLAPVANKTRARGATTNTQLLDREFGDEFRSSRLPAGWFMLPGAIAWLVLISFVLF